MTVMLSATTTVGVAVPSADPGPSGDSRDTFAAVLAQTSDEAPTAPAELTAPAEPTALAEPTAGRGTEPPPLATDPPAADVAVASTGRPARGRAGDRPSADTSAGSPTAGAQALAALLVGQPVPAPPAVPAVQPAAAGSRSTVRAIAAATGPATQPELGQPAQPVAGAPAQVGQPAPGEPGQLGQPAAVGRPAPTGQLSEKTEAGSADSTPAERPSRPTATPTGQPLEPAQGPAADVRRVTPGQPDAAAGRQRGAFAVSGQPGGLVEPHRTTDAAAEPPADAPKARTSTAERTTEHPPAAAGRLEVPPAAPSQSGPTQPGPTQPGPPHPAQTDSSQLGPATMISSPPPTQLPAAPQPSMPNPVAQQLVTPLLRLRSGGDGSHSLTVALHPAELGPVNLHVRLAGDVMTIQLASTSESARDALREALPQLHQELQAAGLPAAGLSLELSGQAPGGSQHFGEPERPAADPDRPAMEQPAPPTARQQSRARGAATGLDRWL